VVLHARTTLETQSLARTHCVARKQSESAAGVYAQQGHTLQPPQWWAYAVQQSGKLKLPGSMKAGRGATAQVLLHCQSSAKPAKKR
jgi:hypothetical protein